MEILEVIKKRRAIRKYQDKQISREDLTKIVEAGLYAPTAGGGQRTLIYALRSRQLSDKIGRLNIAKFDRSKLLGAYVSKEQPSIIDDPKIKSGFYNAPTVCVIFAKKDFLYSIADAFCCAENMVLMATELGISSCIVARGEETFDNEIGKEFLNEWKVPDDYVARCFVVLGYCDGEYPKVKARLENRFRIIE